MTFGGNVPESICNKLVNSFRYMVQYMHRYHDSWNDKVF